MKYSYLPLLVMFILVVSACGNKQAAEPQAVSTEPTLGSTSTPDPCVGDNLTNSVKEVNSLTREFDDTYHLAKNLPTPQTPPYISDLQRIRREAEDQTFPSCLSTLKSYQLAYMNTTIDTMIDFVGLKDLSTANVNKINQGLQSVEQEHNQYTLEIARLLGVTPVSTTPTP